MRKVSVFGIVVVLVTMPAGVLAANGHLEETDMSDASRSGTLRGRTLQWTFTDGPMEGTTFEHEFHEDGSVVWRAVDGPTKGVTGREKRSAVVRVSDNVHVVSYLGTSGHTLTVVLNLDRKTMHAFASSATEWHEMSGTFEVQGAARDAP